MFTSAEYQLLRKRAPEDLKAFFDALGIPAAEVDWADSQKVRRLDAEAEKKVEELLQSKSLIAGCYMLLERAKIPFAFSDTTGALLSSIAANRAEVRRTMILPPQSQEKPEPQMQSRTAEKTFEPSRLNVTRAPVKSGGNALYLLGGAGLIGAGAVWLFVVKGHPVVGAAVTSAGAFLLARGVTGREAKQAMPETRPMSGGQKYQHPQPTVAKTSLPPKTALAAYDQKEAPGISFTAAQADRAMKVLGSLQRLYQAL